MAIRSIYDSPYVVINKDIIRNAILHQDLKSYWVAEMAGIHKTTLRRWLSGQITRVREEHARNIARVLALPIDQITKIDKVN